MNNGGYFGGSGGNGGNEWKLFCGNFALSGIALLKEPEGSVCTNMHPNKDE